MKLVKPKVELLSPEVSKEDIQESLYGLYPNGFIQKEMSKVIKSLIELYPIVDKKLISEIVKQNLV